MNECKCCEEPYSTGAVVGAICVCVDEFCDDCEECLSCCECNEDDVSVEVLAEEELETEDEEFE